MQNHVADALGCMVIQVNSVRVCIKAYILVGVFPRSEGGSNVSCFVSFQVDILLGSLVANSVYLSFIFRRDVSSISSFITFLLSLFFSFGNKIEIR